MHGCAANGGRLSPGGFRPGRRLERSREASLNGQRWTHPAAGTWIQSPRFRSSSSIRTVPPRVLIAVLLAAHAAGAAHAQERPQYAIQRAGTPLTIDGRLDEPAWVAAPAVGDFVFPWHEEGEREQTVAKLLWDDTHLYLAFICDDAHIWGVHTARDSQVWLDDTVEIFTAPNPANPRAYFNIEMNVLGIFLDQYRPAGPGASDEWNGDGIQVRTSLVGTLNDDSDQDSYWILEAAIPFANFASEAINTPPLPGDTWRLNLNRLGGSTNPQFSQWSASRTPRPNFHAPDDFGQVTFSERPSPF
jgi:hypothetical protein